MRVSEILTLMGHLSVGNDNITPPERAIFLQYLNLAHLELYQETANFNQDLLLQETLASERGTNSVTLSRMPYLVSSVYDQTRKRLLTRLSVEDGVEHNPDAPVQGAPCAYFIRKNILTFVPPQTAPVSVSVWYIPQPFPLTEAMEGQASLGQASLEEDIPYPVAYHPVLADGALYYLFQEEGGFKSASKELEARKRWESGKSKLLSYLYSSGGQTLSTFSSI